MVTAGDEGLVLQRGMVISKYAQNMTLGAAREQPQDDTPLNTTMAKPLPASGRLHVWRTAEMKSHSALHGRLAAELRA